MSRILDPYRPVGFESRKVYAQRCANGFWNRYLGPVVVDVGYRGGDPYAVPIVQDALGVEPGVTPDTTDCIFRSSTRAWTRYMRHTCSNISSRQRLSSGSGFVCCASAATWC